MRTVRVGSKQAGGTALTAVRQISGDRFFCLNKFFNTLPADPIIALAGRIYSFFLLYLRVEALTAVLPAATV